MKAKTIILTVILFALIVAGMFVYTKLKRTEQSTAMSHSEDIAENIHSV